MRLHVRDEPLLDSVRSVCGCNADQAENQYRTAETLHALFLLQVRGRMIRDGAHHLEPMSNNSQSGLTAESSTPSVTAEGESWVSSPEKLRYVDGAAPESGAAIALVEGVHWTRIPLPIDLNHINVWLLHTSDGCIVVDTGMAWDIAKDAWQLLRASLFRE